MSSLEQMYQQVIMDHARQAHGKGLDTFEHASWTESHQVNTTCGDEVTLRLGFDGDTITAVSWEGQGCSISQASTSVLHDLIEGNDAAHAHVTLAAFTELMHSRGEPLGDDRDDLLDDATAFVGVGKYPARIKCALLGWMALKDALVKAGKEHHG